MKTKQFPPPLVGVIVYLISASVSHAQFTLCAGSAPANVSGSYDCGTGLASLVIQPQPALTGGCTW